MGVTHTDAGEHQVEEHALFQTPIVVPAELERIAVERGWPDDLVRRALELRMPRQDVEAWLNSPLATPAAFDQHVRTLARVFDGPLRVREATWRDAEALVDLYANAAESVGDWRLVVERGPNPYAQFRLQEHPNLQVVECRGVLLGAAAHATRNSMVGGERIAVHFMSAWRVREGFRGYGLSRVLQTAAGPSSAWFGPVTYWYERVGNASQGWLDKMRTMAELRDNKVDGLTATVHLFDANAARTTAEDERLTVRPVRPDDVLRCVELINATHRGLDIFRPYTTEFLESHLDDPSWGPKPSFIPRVFGWDDYYVVEAADGEVIACAGLWDRGRDMREVWTNRDTGEERLTEPTALLDWGYESGRSDAMALLIRSFLQRTHELGRTHLLAPLEFAADVLGALADLEPAAETRALRCMGFHEGDVHVEPQVTRPYTDLAYW